MPDRHRSAAAVQKRILFLGVLVLDLAVLLRWWQINVRTGFIFGERPSRKKKLVKGGF
jgi:hypothetical protein